MTPTLDVLESLAEDLEDVGLRWAVVGGIAAGVRGEPRVTRDVDLAVAVADDREGEQLVNRLLRAGYRVETVLENTAKGRMATVRLTAHGARGTLVDLLMASSGIEAEVVAGAGMVELRPGLEVPVAQRAHLIAMKVLAMDDKHRPFARVDLLALVAQATPEDLDEARRCLDLITERGYHRGKDLAREFQDFLDRRSTPGSPWLREWKDAAESS